MLVEKTSESTSNIWANNWNPEIETVSRENVTSIDHCSENSEYFRTFHCKNKQFRTYLGPKSRAGLSENPQLCPKDIPTAPIVKPMKIGAIPSATLFFLSVIAMMERTRIAVPTT